MCKIAWEGRTQNVKLQGRGGGDGEETHGSGPVGAAQGAAVVTGTIRADVTQQLIGTSLITSQERGFK